VTNAIKFSKAHASIEICARRSHDGGVALSVTDHGAGMSQAEVAALFSRFRQCGEGQRSKSKGFGLGLSIVRELVDLNLGYVSVKSTPGVGSTFAFTLPADDKAHIISAYAARLNAMSAGCKISVLRVDLDRAASHPDELTQFLAFAMCPHDIHLPMMDTGVLVLTNEASTEDWTRRMTQRWAEYHPNEDDSKLEFTVLGRWEAPELVQQVLPLLSPSDCMEELTLA
jgi:hypothetical protein